MAGDFGAAGAGANRGPVRCATTQWTVVRTAGMANGDPSRRALQQLCATYWYPVFGYVRRRGLSAADAEDACQSFFAWLVESNVVGRADANRGRFRTFLLTAVRQFLAREHRRASAAKRTPPGGAVWSLDVSDGERRYAADGIPAADGASPEDRFEVDWARALIDRAIDQVRGEWGDVGRSARFEQLRDHLVEPGHGGGAAAAARAGMSEGAFRVALHRLKQRFGDVLRELVADSLSDGEDVDAELAELRRAVAGRG